MTLRYDNKFDSEKCTAEPHRAAPCDREAPNPHPLFEGADPFEAEMMRVAMLDLIEDYSGCRPFIAATAKLPPTMRHRLLVNASRALLYFCDDHGAAECLKHALGLDALEPSEEVDRVVETGMQILARMAADEQEEDDCEEDDWNVEDVVRLIDEVHQTPSS